MLSRCQIELFGCGLGYVSILFCLWYTWGIISAHSLHLVWHFIFYWLIFGPWRFVFEPPPTTHQIWRGVSVFSMWTTLLFRSLWPLSLSKEFYVVFSHPCTARRAALPSWSVYRTECCSRRQRLRNSMSHGIIHTLNATWTLGVSHFR